MVNKNNHLESLRQSVNHCLKNLELTSATEFSGIEPPLRERFLDVSQNRDRYVVEIASDALNLQQKLHLEQRLGQELADREPSLQPLQIYYRPAIRPSRVDSRIPAPSPLATLAMGQQRRPVAGVKNIVAVASGKGGVGKSTTSANLAVGLGMLGHRVGLVDCDIYGPSIPLMLGLDEMAKIDADGSKLLPLHAHGIKFMSFGNLTPAQAPIIWRGPMVAKAINQLLFDVAWGEVDYLVCDLPPGTGDIQLTLMQRVPLDQAIVVTTPQDVALIDAEKAVAMFEKSSIAITGIVQNMALHTCSHCGHQEEIFGSEALEDFANRKKLPIIASLPLDRRLRECCDLGIPAVKSSYYGNNQEFMKIATVVSNPKSLTPRANV